MKIVFKLIPFSSLSLRINLQHCRSKIKNSRPEIKNTLCNYEIENEKYMHD